MFKSSHKPHVQVVAQATLYSVKSRHQRSIMIQNDTPALSAHLSYCASLPVKNKSGEQIAYLLRTALAAPLSHRDDLSLIVRILGHM